MQHSAHPQPAGGESATGGLESRLSNMERKLDELASAGKKTDGPSPPEKKRSGFWPDIVKSLIPSLVMLWATYAIKDSVDNAFKERQLQLQNVQAMTQLQNALQNPKITPDDATTDAVQLAAFGRYSIPFFVNVLEVGGENARENAQKSAEQGLRMVSRTEPQEVCAAMNRIITNHTGLYTWTTHLTALILLGEAGCGSSYADVSAYVKELSAPSVLQKWVGPTPVPDQSEYDRIAKQAAATKSLLGSAPKPHWWNSIPAGGTR